MSEKKVPNYEIPQRTIIMLDGKPWQFRFDNAAQDHLEKHYGGTATTLEMLHSLTAYQQEVLDGVEVSYNQFKYHLMPPLIDPNTGACVNALMAEVKAKQDRTKAITAGNGPEKKAPPTSAPETATSAGATSGESSSG